MKSKFGFILIKPQLGENIGACARSMKNFGFKKLNIVSPKFIFPNHKAKTTSVGAFEIMKCTAPIQNLIREAKIHQIPSIMQTAVRDGMITMEKSLEELAKAGKIDPGAARSEH